MAHLQNLSQHEPRTSTPRLTADFTEKLLRRHGPTTILKNKAFSRHIDKVREAHGAAKLHTRNLRELLEKNPSEHEFAGVYVFLSNDRPFYVGITRTIFRRVRSHVRLPNHNTATLLLNLARDLSPHNGPRADFDFESPEALAAQAWLQNQSVAILPLACPVERYSFELYAAMELKTGRWNTFETH